MAKESILVVEDEDDIRELLRYNLPRRAIRLPAQLPEKRP